MAPVPQHSERLLGESPAFLEVLELASRTAPLSKPVLIVGERGTGKELIAERLHYLSQRWDQEFLKMNCAAINEALLESELFGHEAGAFTGATRQHHGRFERADRGTLFLDELAATSPLVQEKLLRVIEYGEFERVGGSKTLTTDVRLIAATNEDLPTLARQSKFREDLLDRLAFDVITLPPLRARPEDIMILAEHFAVNMATELEQEYFAGFTPAARKVLCNYHWPGNIRELKNVVERSVYRTSEPDDMVDIVYLDPFDSPYRPIRSRQVTGAAKAGTSGTDGTGGTGGSKEDVAAGEAAVSAGAQVPAVDEFPIDFKQSVKDYEINLIKSALAASQFNQKKTAEALGVTYHQLRGYLKKYDLLEGS